MIQLQKDIKNVSFNFLFVSFFQCCKNEKKKLGRVLRLMNISSIMEIRQNWKSVNNLFFSPQPQDFDIFYSFWNNWPHWLLQEWMSHYWEKSNLSGIDRSRELMVSQYQWWGCGNAPTRVPPSIYREAILINSEDLSWSGMLPAWVVILNLMKIIQMVCLTQTSSSTSMKRKTHIQIQIHPSFACFS